MVGCSEWGKGAVSGRGGLELDGRTPGVIVLPLVTGFGKLLRDRRWLFLWRARQD